MHMGLSDWVHSQWVSVCTQQYWARLQQVASGKPLHEYGKKFPLLITIATQQIDYLCLWCHSVWLVLPLL